VRESLAKNLAKKRLVTIMLSFSKNVEKCCDANFLTEISKKLFKIKSL